MGVGIRNYLAPSFSGKVGSHRSLLLTCLTLFASRILDTISGDASLRSLTTSMMNLISHAHAKCYFAFENLINAVQHPVRDFTSQAPLKDIQEEFDKYKVWAGNVGAAHSGQRYEISLDYRLREASFFKDQVHSLLANLSENLVKTASLFCGERKPFEEVVGDSDGELSALSAADDGEGDDDSDDSSWDISLNLISDGMASQGLHQSQSESIRDSTIAEALKTVADMESPFDSFQLGRTPTLEVPHLLQSIRFTISCLYRLPIRKAAPLDRLKDRALLESTLYQHFDALYVRDKFPLLDPDIAIRLGEKITQRRQILLYREIHSNNLHTSDVQPEMSLASTEASKLPATRSQTQSKATTSQTHSKATTLRPEHQDSTDPMALYTPSVPESKSSKASSVTGKELQVEMPLRPRDEDGKEKDSFVCPYCLTTQNISTINKWR